MKRFSTLSFRPITRSFLKGLLGVTLLGLICSVIVAVTLAMWIHLTPKTELYAKHAFSTAIYDRHNTLISLNLAADQRYRLHSPFEQLPTALINATIQYEDKHFYTHKGIDIGALFRAFYQSYIKRVRKIGASTITMQVARMHWDLDTRSIVGKLRQMAYALKLESQFSKEHILEAYLNLAPYGGNIEGVAAASLIYFKRPVAQLNELQALSLSVIPQNPSKRMPSTLSKKQRISKAVRQIYDSAPQLFKTLDANTIDLPLVFSKRALLPNNAPHFTQFVLQNTSSAHANKRRTDVHTTLDLNKQAILVSAIRAQLNQLANVGVNNASALLINYKHMRVEAMLGSADFYNTDIDGQVNGTTMKRSPGSTLKPLLYGLSLDAGLIHPASILKDLPKRYGGFTPENADLDYIGPVSAEQALLKSRNLPAVALQKRLREEGDTPFYDGLAAYVNHLKLADHYGLALSLGAVEVSMFDLTAIYASFANAGENKRIKWLSSVSEDIYSGINKKSEHLLSPEAAFLILDILSKHPLPKQNILQNGRFEPQASQADIAWKTGTSWGFRDAWAVGVSGDYVLAVWVGNFDGKHNAALKGFSAAGPILQDIFVGLKDKGYIDDEWRVEDAFEGRPLNLQQVDICQASGDLYEIACPQKALGWFIPGVSPIKPSNIFRTVTIDNQSGLITCDVDAVDTQSRVLAFWPSDIKANFVRAGQYLETIPSSDASCQNAQAYTSSAFDLPIIESPLKQNKLIARKASDGRYYATLTLKATVDGSVETISWHLNHKYIATVPVNQILTKNIGIGRHKIMLIDQYGQRVTTTIEVLSL